MKTDVFYWLLNAGILGALAGAPPLLLRRVRRVPRRVAYVLWALPLLRLWLPFGFSARFSLLNLISRYATKTVPVPLPEAVPGIAASNAVQAAQAYFPITYKTARLERIFTAAALVWLVGALALALTGALLYFFTRAELKGARRLRDNIYVSERVSSPLLCGVFKPRIIIPAHMENRDLTSVLLHERAHARRRDNFFRLLALLTAALHWYNPLVWLFLKRALEDMELACDESVVASLSDDGRRRYALDLLDAAQSRSAFVSAFGGARIRVRVEKILSYRALSIGSAVFLVLFAAALAVTILTNAVP